MCKIVLCQTCKKIIQRLRPIKSTPTDFPCVICDGVDSNLVLVYEYYSMVDILDKIYFGEKRLWE